MVADVEVTNWMGALPADYTALSLNATLEFVTEIDLERKGMVAGEAAALLKAQSATVPRSTS